MTSLQMKYKVRSGTIDSGKKYECKIAALLSLRCVFNKEEDMWISSNADGVGALDDIILHQGNRTFMLQLKHKDDPKPIVEREYVNPKSDFALQKYIRDIINLKDSIESKGKKLQFINYLGNFDNIFFILYTNRDTKTCEFLYNEKDNYEELEILNTSNKIFQINIAKILNLVNEDNFNQIYLFPDQVHAKNVENKINEEIKKLAKFLDIEKIDVKFVTKEYTKFVGDWAEGLLGGHYCLTKNDIICKLTELFLFPYKAKLIQKQFLFYTSKKEQIWNKIIQNEVITLVDYEEEILEFLLKYLGCEIKKYCGEYNYWKDSFSKEAQNEFYQNYDGLKRDMLKIIGNNGIITLLDVYMCLWMNKKVPILLEINDLEEYHDIVNIVKFSSHNYKVIIINKSVQKIFQGVEDTTKCFITANDLDQETRKEILNQEVKFQGRSSVKLGKLVDEDMLKHLNCKDIIKILLNNYSIGNKLNLLPQYFIPRSLSKIFLMSKVLDEVQNEIFLIEESLEKRFIMLPINNNSKICYKLEDINEDSEIILISSGENINIEKFKSVQKPVHHLIIYNENYLEWKSSTKSIKSLRRFQVDLDEVTQEDVIKNKFSAPVNIISAVPGMGKSVLMDYIALQIPTNKWVLRIDLNGHQSYYKNSKASKALQHLEYFKNSLLRTNNIEISNVVFKKLLKTKDVIVILDGFDEVSLCYKHEVTNIAKSLHNEGYKLWITTRPHMNSFLEKEFETFSLSLKSFTRTNQKEFLTNYFYPNKPSSQELLDTFVEKLLNASERNLNDWDAEFTGIPLQTKLLADVFKNDCIKYVTKENLEFNENFDLLYLYQNFVNKKIDIVCEKFGPAAEDIRLIFKEHQSLFALKLLFSQHINLLGYKNIKEQLNIYYKNKPDKIIQLLQREGVVIIDKDFNVNFVHRTFGEYLAAQWLAENINNQKQKEFVHILIKERFTHNYKFLFGLFDRILAKDLPLHMAVINNNKEEFSEIINLNPKTITDCDIGSRTVLHLIALYSSPFPPQFEEGSFNFNQGRWVSPLEAKHLLCNSGDKMLCFVRKILIHIRWLELKKDFLGYTPLDYALSGRSLTIAEEISTQFNSLTTINANINLELKNYYLISTILLDYNSLFNLLLPYFASRELLLGKLNKNILGQDYFKNIYVLRNFSFKYNNENYLVNVSEIRNPFLENKFKNKTILEIFLKTVSDNDIRYVICFGCEKNLEGLLSNKYGLELNQQDHDYNTPLHYAVMYKKPKVVQMLLDKHVDVNKQNSKLDTPLHLVFNSSKIEGKFKSIFQNLGMNKIVNKLISKGADTNLKNNNNNTPLHLALQNKKHNWAKLFIDAGANVTITNHLGETALHITSTHGYNEILAASFSRYNNININVQDNKGQTPLFCATQNNHLIIVEMLLIKSADVNLPEKYGLTVLHLAASLGYNEILIAILNKGKNVDINIEDNHGQTPLFSAVRYNHILTVKLLLDKGANVNIKDKNSLTVFQRAAPLGYNEILAAILEKGCDINAVNKNNETALLCAAQCHKTDTVKFLLDKGADVNIPDKTGLTPFHFFARCGYIEILSAILIKNKIGINIEDNQGRTALLSAAQNNHVDTVKLLLVNGADVNNQDKNGLTVFHLCARSGYNDIVSTMLNSEIKIDINVQDNKGQTPLFSTALNNQVNTINSLLDNGADVNISDNNGLTVLHLLAGSGHADILSKIIRNKNNLEINLQDNKGQTPLFYAVQNNHVDVVKLFLVNDANVNIQDKNGLTPLHLFACYGYLDILTVILSSGIKIDINVKDNKEQTPLFYAAAAQNHHNKKIAKLLLAHDADPYIKDKNALTPFHLFAVSGFVDILSSLLINNTDININMQDNKGQTAIALAVQNNHIDVVKLLFSKGAEIIIPDKNGFTPLHLFAGCGYTDILDTVLNSGMNIDINVQDNNGQTPLFAAVENNHIDIVKLFLANGADVNIRDKNGLTPFDFARCDCTEFLAAGDTKYNLEDKLG